MTDHSALIERLEALLAGEPVFVVGHPVREAISALRDLTEWREGMEEDLFQAVSVAYHRGAVEWTRRNYPKWFDWIEEGRACLPSAPNQAKEAGE